MKNVLAFFLAGFIVIGLSACGAGTSPVSEEPELRQYANPEEAGYSAAALADAESFYDKLDAGAVLVLVDGNVLVNWGDTNRRYFSTSIRKSFLNALIGIAVEDGTMNLDTTLAEQEIDDQQSLTDLEKQATLRDLLSSRSGIYHPAAFEDPGWVERRPERGSHSPGEAWFYNNWDFNTLGTIYERKTGCSIFKAFQTEIADPLGMEDYRLLDGTYFYDTDKSNFPAYLFKMSARDMARFGLLIIEGGIWQGEQLIQQDWIEESLKPISRLPFDGEGYGYLWWYMQVSGYDVHFARGAGEQGIYLIPDLDLIYVFRADTYSSRTVDHREIVQLLIRIMNARENDFKGNASLEPVRWPDRLPGAVPASVSSVEGYLGLYDHPILGATELAAIEAGVVLESNRARFRILSLDGALILEDIEAPLVLQADSDREGTLDLVYDESGDLIRIDIFR